MKWYTYTVIFKFWITFPKKKIIQPLLNLNDYVILGLPDTCISNIMMSDLNLQMILPYFSLTP